MVLGQLVISFKRDYQPLLQAIYKNAFEINHAHILILLWRNLDEAVLDLDIDMSFSQDTKSKAVNKKIHLPENSNI